MMGGMDSLSRILDELHDTLDVELQEGRTQVEIPPELAAAWLARKPPSSAAARRGGAASRPDRAARSPAVASAPAGPAAAARDAPDGDAAGSLEEIAAQIASCTRCELQATRSRTVPGAGQVRPDVLFIGEGPGAEEDAQGIPFVGRAGQLLTRMIEAMGYQRDQVFIANIVKCRPPGNRAPTAQEIEACLPYLRRQITLIRPVVIVPMGNVAVQGLLGTTSGITQLRNRWHAYEGIPVMPTFHPSYLLRFPAVKKDAWADLLMVLKRLGRTPPPRPHNPAPTP